MGRPDTITRAFGNRTGARSSRALLRTARWSGAPSTSSASTGAGSSIWCGVTDRTVPKACCLANKVNPGTVACTWAKIPRATATPLPCRTSIRIWSSARCSTPIDVSDSRLLVTPLIHFPISFRYLGTSICAALILLFNQDDRTTPKKGKWETPMRLPSVITIVEFPVFAR